MSRRQDKAWDEFVAEHLVGGGEEYHVEWASAARALGVDLDGFWEYPHGPDYEAEYDEERLREAVRTAFYNPDGERADPLVVLTLKCQRCDRRIDTFRVRGSRWRNPGTGAVDGWVWEDLQVTSEAWFNITGDSTSELFRKFDGRSLDFDCACGRRHIQFSVRRIRDTLERLTPDRPQWSSGSDDAWIVRPDTRHETIAG